MVAALQGVDGIICSSDPLTARVIESADRLKVIARTGVGYNTVDVKAATARRIPVCILPGANRHAVAEFAFTLMLACGRKLLQNLAEVEKGGWKSIDGVELAGKTLGIVGLGTIGKEMAQRARAFEMRILAHDLVRDEQFAEANGVTYVSLDQLLKESDFVTLHCLLKRKHPPSYQRRAAGADEADRHPGQHRPGRSGGQRGAVSGPQGEADRRGGPGRSRAGAAGRQPAAGPPQRASHAPCRRGNGRVSQSRPVPGG